MEELDRKICPPFVKALLEEIHTAFDMFSIGLIGVSYMVDPIDIPTKNVTEYGNVNWKFYLVFMDSHYKIHMRIILLSVQP